MSKYLKMHTDASFKMYLVVFVMITIYFLIYLFETIIMQKNIYDFLLQMKDMLTISYVVIPLFLILLANSISANSLNSFQLLRFHNKSTYYNKIMQSIIFMATKFLLLVIIIMIGLSLFSLDFQNEWSTFATTYFKNFPFLLQNYLPLQIVIISLSLLWLFLICLGIFYFVLLIVTKSTVLSLVGVVSLVIFNMAMTLSQIDFINAVLFTKHLDFLQYIYGHNKRAFIFPFELYMYWIILFMSLYIIGFRLIHKLDLDVKKGE